MITMIRDNVERKVKNETSAAKLQAKGYEILGEASAKQSGEETPEKSLLEMSVNELRTYAKEQGISGCGGLKKEEIIQLLTEGTEGDSGDDTGGDGDDRSGED